MNNRKSNQEKSVIKKITGYIGGDKLVLLGAIIVVFVLFTSINANFLTPQNMVNLLVAASLVGMVAVGHTYLIIAAQNDLSPGSMVAFSGVFAALMMSKGLPVIVVVLLTIAVCVVFAVFNAWMVNKIRLDAFIATLVTQSIVRGFAYIICDGKPIGISDPGYLSLGKARFLSIPLTVWVMILCVVVFGFILAKTKFGRSIYAIGGNKEAARLAGLNPEKIVTSCFVLMGVLCALGGVLFSSRMNAGQPSANVNLEFDAITAVILGGVSFTGGVGSMGGTVLGVILIQAFNTGLIMVNVPTFWQYVARGALLLFALTSDYIRKEKRNKELLAASMKNA